MKKRPKKSGGLGGYRPGSGRKPMGEEPVKNRSFPCTDTQWKRYKAAADAAGKSVAQWLRDLADAAADDALDV